MSKDDLEHYISKVLGRLNEHLRAHNLLQCKGAVDGLSD